MGGEEGQVADSKGLGVCLVGVVAVGILLYQARNATSVPAGGVPQFQTEEQFNGLSLDVGGRVNVGTPLDMSIGEHFFVGGDCCPGQELRKPRHRYPMITGGNITAVINHGMTAMSLGSPDNDWRVRPPSEYTI